MRIGICDDDKLWCEKAQKIIEEYAAMSHLSMQISVFMSEEEVLRYEGDPLDVLFCDIELEKAEEESVPVPECEDGVAKENGISLAMKVNQRWAYCQIVYLTNYIFYATEVYQTKHVFFVLKDQFEKRIEEIFEKLIHELKQEQERLLFSTIGGGQVILSPNDIYYFERNGRVTNIITKHGEYAIHEKLGAVMEQLPARDFIRCHNSYIVYFPAVREMVKGAFILVNETRVVISRSYAKKAKEAFMQWALTQFF